MALPRKSDVHRNLPEGVSACSFLTKPAPKCEFPKEGIEWTSAYQLAHDQLLLGRNSCQNIATFKT